jgi:transcriptional regulator of acetoin/glycerol metabolism
MAPARRVCGELLTGSAVSLSPAAAAAIKRYHWPSNVRELRDSLVRLAMRADNNTIEADDLPNWLLRCRHSTSNH